MNNRWIKYSLIGILLFLADIFLIGKMEFSTWVRPHIYVLWILILPVSIPRIGLLTLAFLTGFAMDVFSNTGGMHAAALTTMTFIRIFYVRIFLTTEDMESRVSPNLGYLGFRGFLFYAGPLLFFFHFFLFGLEIFKHSYIIYIFLKGFFSSIAALIVVLFIQLILRGRKGNV